MENRFVKQKYGLLRLFHFIEEPADKCAKATGAKPMRRGNSIQIIYLEAE